MKKVFRHIDCVSTFLHAHIYLMPIVKSHTLLLFADYVAKLSMSSLS